MDKIRPRILSTHACEPSSRWFRMKSRRTARIAMSILI